MGVCVCVRAARGGEESTHKHARGGAVKKNMLVVVVHVGSFMVSGGEGKRTENEKASDRPGSDKNMMRCVVVRVSMCGQVREAHTLGVPRRACLKCDESPLSARLCVCMYALLLNYSSERRETSYLFVGWLLCVCA